MQLNFFETFPQCTLFQAYENWIIFPLHPPPSALHLPPSEPSPLDALERKKRVRRGEEEDTSKPPIISQLRPSHFCPFFRFSSKNSAFFHQGEPINAAH